MQKVLSLDKKVADLYKHIGDLKRSATPSGDHQPKPPPQSPSFESFSQVSVSTKQCKNHSDDKTPPWLCTPKCPIDANEIHIYRGENYYFCPKCLYHGSWQTNLRNTEHNAQHAKEVKAAFEKCNPDAYKSISNKNWLGHLLDLPPLLIPLQLMWPTLPLILKPNINTLQSALIT